MSVQQSAPTSVALNRDHTKIDPVTNNPFCFGFQSPEALVCLMCSFEQTCREQKKVNKASGGNATSFFSTEEDPFEDEPEDDYDDNDDDMFDDEV